MANKKLSFSELTKTPLGQAFLLLVVLGVAAVTAPRFFLKEGSDTLLAFSFGVCALGAGFGAGLIYAIITRGAAEEANKPAATPPGTTKPQAPTSRGYKP